MSKSEKPALNNQITQEGENPPVEKLTGSEIEEQISNLNTVAAALIWLKQVGPKATAQFLEQALKQEKRGLATSTARSSLLRWFEVFVKGFVDANLRQKKFVEQVKAGVAELHGDVEQETGLKPPKATTAGFNVFVRSLD
ncbi:MAG: hypothetical protein GF390_01990 [Candidatus Pacebacteria bacterium]|nr:hypothetical protein [Candidatus Paceibacterota bacterium]